MIGPASVDGGEGRATKLQKLIDVLYIISISHQFCEIVLEQLPWQWAGILIEYRVR